RDTGSSTKPLPNPTQGYDQHAAASHVISGDLDEIAKNCLTNKEESIGDSAYVLDPSRLVVTDALRGCDQ
ncbi:MAG: hypothetical protein ACRDZ9_00920, partial [Acidimicrobiales bacterium]